MIRACYADRAEMSSVTLTRSACLVGAWFDGTDR